MRLLREAGVLITDSREGLFLIRLVGFRSSPQPDNLSGGVKDAEKRGRKSESETEGSPSYHNILYKA